MALAPGTRFGSYEVVEPIGSGGMGEVYRATDTGLKRDVALKVLPEAFVEEGDRLARFQREAEILAALNHPNIAQVYGLENSGGQTAIVMELVEGPTLADLIQGGAIASDEVMSIALQIISALEAAHDKQIVHRDLKPANVKVRDDGTVKVLDFGISKPIDASTISGGSAVATTPAVTQTGVILGTAAYMSPEQARGKFVDERTDIWAFGCLLFEMLTGQPVFGGEDVMMTLARVLDRDADLKSIPKAISPAVRHTIKLCLEKDSKRRIADIRDVRLALEGTFESELPHAADVSADEPRRRRWIMPGAVLVLGIAAGVAGTAILGLSHSDESGLHAVNVPLTLPVDRTLTLSTGRLVALAPDGQTLVYRAEEGGVFKLFMHPLGSFETTVIPGSEGVAGELLFFSPDSRSVGFNIGGKLMRAQLTGGRPVPVSDVTLVTREAAWGGDDSTWIAQRNQNGLLHLAADGTELEPVRVPEALQAQSFNQFWYPQLLSGDRALLVTAASALAPDSGSLVIIDLTTNEARTIMPLATAGYVLPAGFLLFMRGADLWAARFDLKRLEVVGDPTVVLSGVRVEGGGAVQMTVADNGTIAYIPGTLTDRRIYQLMWVDRERNEEPVGAPGAYDYLDLSPDGTRVALTALEGGNWDIRIMDLERGGMSRLTSDTGIDQDAIWSPDGTEILWSTLRSGAGIYRRAANGTTPEEPLITGQPDARIWPAALVPDQNAVIVNDAPDGRRIVSLLSVGEEATRTPIIEESDDVRRPVLSPDGRWIAYESLETGRAEIRVRPFPDVDANRIPISTSGGRSPVWSQDGRRLFFFESGVIYEVEFDTESGSAGDPVPVVDGPYAIETHTWDVSPDGARFLVRKEITSGVDNADERERDGINVVVYFSDVLNRLLPSE